MKDWFDIDRIDEDTYMISEYGHPEKVHSYLLLDDGLAYMIDTGLGIGNIKQVTDSLTSLPIKVITTHLHWDHVGGHWHYEDILVHKAEAAWMTDGMPRTIAQIRSFILDGPVTKPYPDSFNIDSYRPFKGKPSRVYDRDETLAYGKRRLNILYTPGHSPGHVCVYEKDRGYLFTGDLLYMGELYAHLEESNPADYLASLAKISRLDNLSILLPSHNEIIKSPELIKEAYNAFLELEKSNTLSKGTGVHEYKGFKIRL